MSVEFTDWNAGISQAKKAQEEALTKKRQAEIKQAEEDRAWSEWAGIDRNNFKEGIEWLPDNITGFGQALFVPVSFTSKLTGEILGGVLSPIFGIVGGILSPILNIFGGLGVQPTTTNATQQNAGNAANTGNSAGTRSTTGNGAGAGAGNATGAGAGNATGAGNAKGASNNPTATGENASWRVVNQRYDANFDKTADIYTKGAEKVSIGVGAAVEEYNENLAQLKALQEEYKKLEQEKLADNGTQEVNRAKAQAEIDADVDKFYNDKRTALLKDLEGQQELLKKLEDEGKNDSDPEVKDVKKGIKFLKAQLQALEKAEEKTREERSKRSKDQPDMIKQKTVLAAKQEANKQKQAILKELMDAAKKSAEAQAQNFKTDKPVLEQAEFVRSANIFLDEVEAKATPEMRAETNIPTTEKKEGNSGDGSNVKIVKNDTNTDYSRTVPKLHEKYTYYDATMNPNFTAEHIFGDVDSFIKDSTLLREVKSALNEQRDANGKFPANFTGQDAINLVNRIIDQKNDEIAKAAAEEAIEENQDEEPVAPAGVTGQTGSAQASKDAPWTAKYNRFAQIFANKDMKNEDKAIAAVDSELQFIVENLEATSTEKRGDNGTYGIYEIKKAIFDSTAHSYAEKVAMINRLYAISNNKDPQIGAFNIKLNDKTDTQEEREQFRVDALKDLAETWCTENAEAMKNVDSNADINFDELPDELALFVIQNMVQRTKQRDVSGPIYRRIAMKLNAISSKLTHVKDESFRYYLYIDTNDKKIVYRKTGQAPTGKKYIGCDVNTQQAWYYYSSAAYAKQESKKAISDAVENLISKIGAGETDSWAGNKATIQQQGYAQVYKQHLSEDEYVKKAIRSNNNEKQ